MKRVISTIKCKKKKKLLLLPLFVLLSVKVVQCAFPKISVVCLLCDQHAICCAGPILERLTPFWLFELIGFSYKYTT